LSQASRVASGLLFCLHAIAITPAGSMELVRSSVSIVGGLPCAKVRSAPAIVFSGPAQRSLTLWAARSPSRLATLSIESSDSFVASAAASIATGWSEPVPGREFHLLKSSAFSRRTLSPTENAYVSNAKIRFQSLFMLITGHPFAFASSYSACVNVPTLLSGNPRTGP